MADDRWPRAPATRPWVSVGRVKHDDLPTASGIAAVPVSFQVDGKQYIAVQSGWGVDPAKMQARMNLIFPGKYPDVPQGGTIWVFALK